MNGLKPHNGLKIALWVGVSVLIGSAIALLIFKLKKRNQVKQSLGLVLPPNSSTIGRDYPKNENTALHNKRMQLHLLNLGKAHNNKTIMDAILLSGGIDGILGAGFNTALGEAIERGYLMSFEDLSSQVS